MITTKERRKVKMQAKTKKRTKKLLKTYKNLINETK